MKTLVDYLIIFFGALAQASFLPLNFVLLFLVYLFFRKGFEDILPKLVFGSVLLALVAGDSIGLYLLVFALVLGTVGFLKRLLPSAFFIRVSLLILSVPYFSLAYQKAFSLLLKI